MDIGYVVLLLLGLVYCTAAVVLYLRSRPVEAGGQQGPCSQEGEGP